MREMKRRWAKTKLEMEEALPQLTLTQGLGLGRRKQMVGQQTQAPTRARLRGRRGMKREGSSLER